MPWSEGCLRIFWKRIGKFWKKQESDEKQKKMRAYLCKEFRKIDFSVELI